MTVLNNDTNDKLCSANDTTLEDVMVGKCLMNAGVQPGDSRDKLHRERFMPLWVGGLLIPNKAPKWVGKYDFYPTKEVYL